MEAADHNKLVEYTRKLLIENKGMAEERVLIG